MEIKLTNEECEKFFYNALCNIVSTGYFRGYGIELEYSESDYEESRKKLNDPCVEDVWLRMLCDGKSLTFTDFEGDGENTKVIKLEDIHAGVPKAPAKQLIDMANEEDDAGTADDILQTVLYGEIIFA